MRFPWIVLLGVLLAPVVMAEETPRMDETGGQNKWAVPSREERQDRLGQLWQESTVVVRARVVGRSVAEQRGTTMVGETAHPYIVRRVQCEIQEVYKGEMQVGRDLAIDVPGGCLETQHSGSCLPDYGYPTFIDGERVLLFLSSDTDGTLHLIDRVHGKQRLFRGELSPLVLPLDQVRTLTKEQNPGGGR